MKNILIILFCFISSICFGQITRDSIVKKGDTTFAYFKNGCLKEKTFYKINNSKIQQPVSFWSGFSIQYFEFACGQIRVELIWDSTAQGRQTHRKAYSSSGKLLSERINGDSRIDSVRTDSSTIFYFDGLKSSEIIRYPYGKIKTYLFDDSEKFTQYIILNPRAHPLDTVVTGFPNGERIVVYWFHKIHSKNEGNIFQYGREISYYSNGQIKTLRNSKYHKFVFSIGTDGPYLAYYENGNLKEKGQYRRYTWTRNPCWPKMNMTPKYWPETRKKGKWITYYENWNISGIYRYRRGSIMRKKLFDENGKVIERKKYWTINQSRKKEDGYNKNVKATF